MHDECEKDIRALKQKILTAELTLDNMTEDKMEIEMKAEQY